MPDNENGAMSKVTLVFTNVFVVIALMRLLLIAFPTTVEPTLVDSCMSTLPSERAASKLPYIMKDLVSVTSTIYMMMTSPGWNSHCTYLRRRQEAIINYAVLPVNNTLVLNGWFKFLRCVKSEYETGAKPNLTTSHIYNKCQELGDDLEEQEIIWSIETLVFINNLKEESEQQQSAFRTAKPQFY
jgi:hypothetical protein